jgi:anthranilate phosphoribosyltransferase
VIEIENGQQRAYTIDPVQCGFQRCDKNALLGGDAMQNAALLTAAFNGESGPIADTIILNAAMAVYLYGKASDLMAAIEMTREHLFSKKASTLLKNWVSV